MWRIWIWTAVFGWLFWVFTIESSLAANRPNFLFIVTDDQSPDSLSAYGNRICQTPNIDRIAREGILIRDAHHMGSWSGAVCLPSRTMLMTGRSVWRIPGRVRTESPEQQHIFTEEAARTSMPALFRAAGYDTFRTCKAGNTFKAANAHFEHRYESDKRGAKPGEGSDWHADRVLDYLYQRRASQDQDPFLIFLGFSHPHDPRNGTPELLAKYGAVNASEPPVDVNPANPPLPIGYLPAHPFIHGHDNVRDEVAVNGVRAERSEAAIRNELGRQYACIEFIDIQVGRVLNALEDLGELENTYIFFTSDHGIALGRHGLMGKQNLYEHTWRVPFAARGPGIRPGSEVSGYIYLMDVLPTLCDLAGIKTPQAIEGTSFRPVLEGKRDRIRDVVYGVYCGGTKPGIRSIKADGWKLIRYDSFDGTQHVQLFNLHENPHELLTEHQDPEVVALTGYHPKHSQVDLAEDPRFAHQRKKLEALLLAEQQRLDDPYIEAESK